MNNIKQINECFDRFFTGKLQRKTKWQVHQPNLGDFIVLFCNDNMALLIDPDTLDVMYQWEGQSRADKNGIIAAIKYLTDNKEKLLQLIANEKTKVEKIIKNNNL